MASAFAFQAEDASSILVTRSKKKKFNEKLCVSLNREIKQNKSF